MSRVGESPRNLCGDPWEQGLTQDFLSPQEAPSSKTFPVPCVSFLIPITNREKPKQLVLITKGEESLNKEEKLAIRTWPA